ncbi:glycosyltransferase [Panacibacter ginsenosidivorans]|uniref:Glycosyltransferase n=1 Tax=Panacibacter ginsenosidivorans TaxID=1813871 RepID=A0A5B8V8J6_9BACT|nr:glycosyltransferase [Panacibacter ginsenosidivorans]QEC67485.1 glycosyltransferase [Panacibacter ginsenosidivorans]
MIAPLDWGLGHASRCIPIIKYLQKRGCKVIIASDGEQLNLLKKEFPGLEFVKLKGYNVRYSKYKRWLGAKILWQTPKILLRIRHEHTDLGGIVDKYDIDVVISDNRYGLHTNKVPCIFITHQLIVKSPFPWLQNFIQKINYRFISRFTECWIPDFEGKKNIAGLLSHPEIMPPGINKYIGPLSRFSREEKKGNVYKYFFVLSGPEPQRTILEEKIMLITPKLSGKILVVRGKPTEPESDIAPGLINIKNHLTTDEMQNAFLQSEYIISRAGYTTIMELLSLGKKSILMPTPGQTEQEYLADHLMQQQWCYKCKQDDDLLFHILKAEKFDYVIPGLDEPFYEKVIDDFLISLDCGV